MSFMILAVAAVGCTEDPIEDTFSTSPVAPILESPSDVLITKTTDNENVTFAWSAARFVGDEVNYTLTATYNEQSIELGSTTALAVVMTKSEFKEKLYAGLDLPKNTTFSVSFNVTAKGSEGDFTSATKTLNIYAYGDYIEAAIPSDNATEFTLLADNFKDEIELIHWDAAILEYNAAVTYSVELYNAAAEKSFLLATDIDGLSYSTTVDALNEALIKVGVAEEATAEIGIIVKAYSATATEGIPSATLNVKATTFKASYPDAIYLAGSFQGWNPATGPRIPMVASIKGYYEGFVNLTDGASAETQFKVCKTPAWGEDVGSNDMAAADEEGNSVISGTLNASDNIVVPNGVYRVCIDLKAGTIKLVKAARMGLIGDATPNGWGDPDTEMTYDAANNSYSVIAQMISGKEYKFRMNNAWKYSIGDNGLFDGGANFRFEQPDGLYQITINVNTAPYSVSINNTANPLSLNIVSEGKVVSTLAPYGEGYYDGFVTVGTDLSFSAPKAEGASWSEKSWFVGAAADGKYALETTGTPFATTAGLTKVSVDVVNNRAEVFPISKIGLIGGFNGWGGDLELVLDTTSNTYKAIFEVAEDGEFKIRFNGGWDLDLGGDVNNLTYKGANILVKAGKYNVELNIQKHPYRLVLTAAE